MLEGILLLLNRGKCPLTPLAARYTDASGDNFDIFLPTWLARNNKVIFSALFLVGVLMVIYRMVL